MVQRHESSRPPFERAETPSEADRRLLAMLVAEVETWLKPGTRQLTRSAAFHRALDRAGIKDVGLREAWGAKVATALARRAQERKDLSEAERTARIRERYAGAHAHEMSIPPDAYDHAAEEAARPDKRG